MNIDKIMNPNVKTITPDNSLFEAAQLMHNEGIGFLIVSDKNEFVGTLTDRDIVTRGVSGEMDMRTSSVRDIMTTDVAYCNQNHTIDEVADRMNETQVQRMPIVGDDKALAGVVSLGDMAQHVSQEVVGQTLKGITASAH